MTAKEAKEMAFGVWDKKKLDDALMEIRTAARKGLLIVEIDAKVIDDTEARKLRSLGFHVTYGPFSFKWTISWEDAE